MSAVKKWKLEARKVRRKEDNFKGTKLAAVFIRVIIAALQKSFSPRLPLRLL